jgi:hypothetical protein
MGTTVTLPDVIAKLPSQFQPWATEYAPAFLAMTVVEFQAWVALLIAGDVYTAYKAVLAKLPGKAEYMAELDKNAAEWAAANAANADSIALQRKALNALVSILLAIGLACFGF